MTSLAQTTELAALLQAGHIKQALELCERKLAEGGGRYYQFWYDRLRPQVPGSVSHLPSLHAQMRAALCRGFADHAYSVPADAPPPPADQVDAAHAAALARTPFKAEIYRPTAKIPLAEQVRGLNRVAALTQPENLAASEQRFRMLREWVRARGTRRVFVLGNGPSLKQTDLQLLRNEITIGFNGIFLHDSFTPTIYVVEDHLVAEDRAREIHAYTCPVKIFPSYLGYCIDPQENTIFLNHRPRISYPVDTDFSADAGHITYTGGTVTYTGLQIAASLGVEEIILLGVDASYQVHNVERSDSYGTGVLTSKEDDTNHFDPRYFGKGYRWHDPNVHTMLQAYRKAREHARDHGLRILNAGIGGQLEVFPRVDYHQLFPREQVFPRLAVLDFTWVNRLSATGVVKKNLLAGWPRSSQFHAYADDKSRLIANQTVPNDLYAAGADDSMWAVWRSLVEFDPQVLYLRPTADRMPMTIVQAIAAAVLGKPWLVHYMDDWLLKVSNLRTPEVARAYRELMQWFFSQAAEVLTICPKMSRFMVDEFGLPAERLHSVHNMLPDDLPRRRRQVSAGAGTRCVRYFGGLEPDMGLSTLLDLARKIETHNRQQPAQPLRLEIYAPPHALTRHGPAFADFPATRVLPQFEDYQDYLACLTESDLNLICYNFDDASLDYVRYSLANKLPELIACGTPFLAVGHAQIGTMELLAEHGYPLCVTQPGFALEPLLELAFKPDETQTQAWRAALKSLREEFSVESNRGRLHALLRRSAAAAAARPTPVPLAALRVILAAAPHQLKESADVELLLALPQLPGGLLQAALGRVRGHARSWSVRDEFPLLKKLLEASALADCRADEQQRALAFLICSLGQERFEPVNVHVRAWLRSYLGE